jgi:cysteine desulfurase
MTAETPIYLDHNATTPILPEVVDAMLPYLREHFGNPSSSHVYGQRAQQAVARARAQVAALIGCDDDEVIFTSGGTEANNLAIRGVTEPRQRRHVVTSALSTRNRTPCAGWNATAGVYPDRRRPAGMAGGGGARRHRR